MTIGNNVIGNIELTKNVRDVFSWSCKSNNDNMTRGNSTERKKKKNIIKNELYFCLCNKWCKYI